MKRPQLLGSNFFLMSLVVYHFGGSATQQSTTAGTSHSGHGGLMY
jgi:hypothetical protein